MIQETYTHFSGSRRMHYLNSYKLRLAVSWPQFRASNLCKFESYTLWKIDFHFLSNWMGHDHGDSFPFDFEPYKIPFGSRLKEKLLPWSCSIKFGWNWKSIFLSAYSDGTNNALGLRITKMEQNFIFEIFHYLCGIFLSLIWHTDFLDYFFLNNLIRYTALSADFLWMLLKCNLSMHWMSKFC